MVYCAYPRARHREREKEKDLEWESEKLQFPHQAQHSAGPAGCCLASVQLCPGIIKLWKDIRRIISHKSNLPIPRVSTETEGWQAGRLAARQQTLVPDKLTILWPRLNFVALIWWTLWRLCLGKQLDNWCISVAIWPMPFSICFGHGHITNVKRADPKWPQQNRTAVTVTLTATANAFYVVHVMARRCFECAIENFCNSKCKFCVQQAALPECCNMPVLQCCCFCCFPLLTNNGLAQFSHWQLHEIAFITSSQFLTLDFRKFSNYIQRIL